MFCGVLNLSALSKTLSSKATDSVCSFNFVKSARSSWDEMMLTRTVRGPSTANPYLLPKIEFCKVSAEGSRPGKRGSKMRLLECNSWSGLVLDSLRTAIGLDLNWHVSPVSNKIDLPN